MGSGLFSKSDYLRDSAKAQPYNPLEHIARSIWLTRYSAENLFGMFTSYFDASIAHKEGVTIVAGWLSTIAEWEQFDIDWRLLLARYDVPYFHMNEFAHSTGAFSSWKGREVKRENFIKKAIGIIKDRVRYGAAMVIEHGTFDEVNSLYQLSENYGNPYSLAGRHCVAEVHKWLEKNGYEPPIEYIFEDGDVGKGQLIELMEKSELPLPLFKPSRDRKTKSGIVPGLRPLQAADLTAYELLKGFKTGEHAPRYKHRESLKALVRIPKSWRKQTKPKMIVMCKEMDIPIRNSYAAPDS